MASHQPQHGGSTSVATQQSRGGNVGHQSSGATAQVKEATQRAGEQLKDSAQSTADALRQRGEGFFSEQTGKAASQLSSLSSAIRGAGDKLRSDQNDPTARYADLVADQLDHASEFIGKQDVGSLLSEVERAARRRPELFLGGMFLLGLGVSRFLKASSDSAGNQTWRTQGSP